LVRFDRGVTLETFFATCPRGLEEELEKEFRALGGKAIRVTPGGVECQGPFPLCYRLNLESRIASRILWRVGQGSYRHEEDLYRLASQLPWSTWFSVNSRIKVRLVAQHSPLNSLEFATLRVKDAICDRFLREVKKRPEVDKRNPDIQIVVFVDEDQVVWYLDTTGAPLFKRGWRQAAGEAPLRENLAAGILRLSGWTSNQVLLDPMCGSGTILIEAALMAKGVAPGARREFSFRHLRNFDRSAWAEMRPDVQQGLPKTPHLELFGCDQDAQALSMARSNLQYVGLGGVQVTQGDVLDVMPPANKGVMITNPPYGVRMGSHATLEDWYPKFGDVLKQRFAGWSVYLLTADFRLPKLIRLAPSRKIQLFNGALESRLYEFQMVAGGNRKDARLSKRHIAN
jgi:putative N6-adenine-specific DNA methylase